LDCKRTAIIINLTIITKIRKSVCHLARVSTSRGYSLCDVLSTAIPIFIVWEQGDSEENTDGDWIGLRDGRDTDLETSVNVSIYSKGTRGLALKDVRVGGVEHALGVRNSIVIRDI